MAAIVTLTQTATRWFRGGSHVTGQKATDLSGILRILQAKVNEVVGRFNNGTLDQLVVDDITGYYGGGTNLSWFYCDGVNPPTLATLRIQASDNGLFYDITVAAGALVVTPA